MRLFRLMAAAMLIFCVGVSAESSVDGPQFVEMKAGTIGMGESGVIKPTDGGPPGFLHGDFDEHPAHEVQLTAATRISATEITVGQYRQFRPECPDTPDGLVRGVTWHEAMAYCAWLSERDGKPYRLPTEAEWEFACRKASAPPPFVNSDPGADTAVYGQLQGMQSGPAEWCLDWYGPYSAMATTDPAGPESGYAKVVRGGGTSDYANQEISLQDPYYARPANRASLAPDYPPKHLEPGLAATVWGNVGFRVVQAPMPEPTAYTPPSVPFVQQGVKDTVALAKSGPDPAHPHFRRREVLPIPPDNVPWTEYAALGLFPGVLPHFHSPAAVVCDNGDVLVSYFTSPTSKTEYWPNVSFALTRLRFGSDEWDMPELFFDFADVVEETPLFFKDGQQIWYITGGVGLPGVPFKWRVSDDHGATWGPVQFPRFSTPIGPHTAQPINSVFRDAAGVIYIASDGEGATSVLWSSADNGATWQDTGGRSGGRHTTYTALRDGRILGMGGKNSNIEGFMPRSISADGGKTWQIYPAPFAALATNQRPTLLRLQSGRLFFAGDYQRHADGKQPSAITERGAYVALSEDEGETWRIKTLPLTLPHEKWAFPDRQDWFGPEHDAPTLGYSVSAQGPDGLIHLITSMNHPNLHFAVNEAWILAEAGPEETQFGAPLAVESFTSGANGMTMTWQGGRDAAGQFVLEGVEKGTTAAGVTVWEVVWRQGRREGTEIYRQADGRLVWEWQHAAPPAVSTWTQYDGAGSSQSVTQWVGRRLAGR